MEVVQVQPRDSHLHNIYVSTKATVIKWSFTTKKNNISFGLFRRKEKEPLPNSTDILFRTQKRQLSFSNDLKNHQDLTVGDEDIEASYINSSNQSIYSNHSTSTSNTRPRAKSGAAAKLKEHGLEEIIPIRNYPSSSQKIEGTFTVKESGNYVLVFDNTFSRNTPKMLTYTVALGNEEDAQVPENEVSGWILKKKRKRMQGWAKRWFTLSPTGVLSYSTSQHGVTRGSIQILVSTISYKSNTKQINIDSGTMIYHLKALSEADYERWHSALMDVRKQNGEIDYPIQEDVIVNKRLSSIRPGDNKRIKAEIEQGLEACNSHIQNIELLSSTIQELKNVLIANDLGAIQRIVENLDHYKHRLSLSAKEQYSQWKAVQQHYSSRRSGSFSPLIQVTTDQDAILEGLEIPNRSSSVNSRLSSFSMDQFYDAEDIVISDDDDEREGKGDDDFDQNSNLIINNEESSDDDDEEEEEEEEENGSITSHSETSNGVLSISSMTNCTRRSALPSPAVADAGSALGVIRKNVGKDLSTISMPISMNEPLNMLQKACEELEYCDLLQKAATLPNSIERLIYVTVFSISTYASTQYRTGRKPFNPMMTETYENIRPDKGFRYISEKVSHNPLVIAAHAEAKEFKYWQSTQVKSKFWGKSMEFMTEGTFHVSLTGHDDHFTFYKPSSWMKNMIAGEKYLEHSGECKVMNQATGEYAIVVFKEGTGGGLFGAPTKRNDIIATFYDANDKKIRRVVGKWSDSLAEEVNMDKRKLSVLWNASPPGIANHESYFGFTKFACELNEITEIEQNKLPITDTRYRTDQLLYEKGLVDEADHEKQRIEQQQRERRKEFEAAGKEWKPRWFVREGDEWVYNGQYWPTRETGQWPKDQFKLW